jgi:hypothetical protein
LLLRAAASRSDHILACGEDASSQNVSVKSTLCEIAASQFFTQISLRILKQLLIEKSVILNWKLG